MEGAEDVSYSFKFQDAAHLHSPKENLYPIRNVFVLPLII